MSVVPDVIGSKSVGRHVDDVRFSVLNSTQLHQMLAFLPRTFTQHSPEIAASRAPSRLCLSRMENVKKKR